MINISKALTEPQPLQEFKTITQVLGVESPCNYSLFMNPQKNNYKLALLEEQHFLCAYCNRNLDEFSNRDKIHHLKIEHWYPQSLCKTEPGYNTTSGRDVAHENMLIACPGENVNPNFTHCDSSRTAKSTLRIKPQERTYRFENIFRYEGGTLKTDITDIQYDVTQELNLNDQLLIRRRNIALDQFIKCLPAKNTINKQTLIQKYTTPNRENKLKEYCTIIIFFINNSIN